jgi:hypothetical protein
VLTISNSQRPDNEFQVPECIEMALQPLVRVVEDTLPVPVPVREITKDTLDRIVASDKDSNEGVVGAIYQCDVVADGKEVLRLVLEGLKRRILHPVHPEERLMVVSRDKAR